MLPSPSNTELAINTRLAVFQYNYEIQGDQLNMIALFWYLEKSDLSSIHVYSSMPWTGHILQGTKKNTAMFNWSPCSPEPDLLPVGSVQTLYRTQSDQTSRS